VKKVIGFYPCPDVDTAGTQVVSHAGTVLLTETITRVGLDHALSSALGRWRPRLAVHDPAKVLLDLALGLAVGGDCLADVAVLRAEPTVFGPVASDPTVSRTIDRLAHDATAALAAIDTARAAARARAWTLAGDHAPDYRINAGSPLVIDVDATLVTAHSDKEGAAPTFKKGFGHHPLWAFVDHGPDGTGEPLAALLRPGNAGSNTAADHLTVIRAALRQLPGHRSGHRPGRKILVRVDGAGATHELLDWLHTQRRAAPARPRTLGRPRHRRPRPAPCARRPRLNTTPPVPTTQDPDRTRGPAPAERPRPNCHTQQAECPHHTGQHQCRSSQTPGRNIRARVLRPGPCGRSAKEAVALGAAARRLPRGTRRTAHPGQPAPYPPS
jgi:hypothetical protein